MSKEVNVSVKFIYIKIILILLQLTFFFSKFFNFGLAKEWSWLKVFVPLEITVLFQGIIWGIVIYVTIKKKKTLLGVPTGIEDEEIILPKKGSFQERMEAMMKEKEDEKLKNIKK